MTRKARTPLLTLAAALVLAAASPAAAETITLTDDGFEPSHAIVEAGEAVHFESEAGEKWSVVAAGGLFDSGELAPAGGFSVAPSVPGIHVYRSAHGTEHEARLSVRTRTLPGQPDDPAAPRIPDIPFPPVEPGDVDVHSSFGVEASTTRIMLGFRQDATVGEVNDALDDANVRILGGLSETGMLLVEAPGSSGEGGSRFASLESALASLRTSPGVAYAAMSTVQETKAVPRRADDTTAGSGNGWDWDDPFTKGNWGLVWSQFPEAWNLLESLKRKQPKVITGIVDGGFEEHPDLPGLQVQPQVCRAGGQDCLPLQNRPDLHGNHVAGIIGAAYDNELEGAPSRSLGVSGANPVARMHGYPMQDAGIDPQRPLRAAMLADQQLQLFARILAGRPAELRVINYSMGAADFNGDNWQDAYGDKLCGPGAADDDLPEMQAPMKEVCTPNNLDSWQREIANAGRAAAPIVRNAAQQGVMIVQAAGNEGKTFCPSGQCQAIDAAARGEFAWVSKHWDDAGVGQDGLPNPVFVVQSMDNEGKRLDDSTLGGTIAAPGHQILSTALGQGYTAKSGSSMATPYVTGLIGQLLADDPSLSVADVRRLVVGWAGGRPGTTGSADFTYEMADRMNRDVMGDGLVDYLTHKSDLKPIRWKVELDACASSANGSTVATYTWSVDGEVVGSTPDCTFTWKPFDEGTYDVTLTVTGAGGEESSVTKPVEVKDLVIVSVGDSIASGEGNPDVESPNARWQLERCHRTAFAGPAQAARWLEGADERSSITFLHLACSGGRIEGDKDGVGPDAPLKAGFEGVGGLLTPYEGVTEDVDDSACALSLRTDLSVCEPPQLDQAVELLDGRQPDALTISIGANDMWFSSILTECIIPLNSCHENEDGKGLFEWRIQLLPGRYARLAAAIESRWPDLPSENVIITQYPDLTTDENGEIDMSCGTAVGISEAEQQWAHDTVIPALNAQVADAAAAHGWTIAEGIPESFHRHGYCSSDPWVVDITGTFWDQGDKNGAFHPNYEGHSAYARKIAAALRERLGLQQLTPNRPLKDSAPRLNAYRALAGNGHARRVADVNDPSKDGNRRVERTVAAGGGVTEKPDEKSGHAEDERTAPDGRVDMRDLRRFRDAWLQRCLAEDDGCPAAGDITLDGGPDHPKRDLNLDGCVKGGLVGCGAREQWFSRFDFNGDRKIDPFAEWMVPWKEDGSPASGGTEATNMTDLDVLEAAWTGGESAEGWTKADLEELMRSGDVEVHAGAVLDDGATKAQVQVRRKGGANVGPERTIRRSEGQAVLTVPVEAPGQEFEIVTTATTDRGAMSSVSEPFSLEYGEDRFVAVCPDVSLKAAPDRVPAGGDVTSVITATVEKCEGREDVEGKDVTFTLEPSDGGTVEALEPQTDASGRAQAIFTPGDEKGTYTVKAAVQVDEDAEPLTAELEIEVVPLVTIKYVWKQTIEDWGENGTTRWGMDAFQPDCVGAGAPYCIEEFDLGLESQTLGGVQRAGTLTGGGDRFKLTENVSNTGASSLTTWNVTKNDEEQRNLDGGARATWHVTDPDAYAQRVVAGLSADDQAGGLRLSGMQAVGDLPYHYELQNTVWGTEQPKEIHSARSEYLLIPQGSRKIRFAAQPEEDLLFPKDEDGFGQYVSCGRLDQTLQNQKGYYVQGPSDYIPGAVMVNRKPEYAPGDVPMPIGESRLKVRYAFAATVAYEGQPVAEPQLPDCTQQNPPQADFEIKPSTDPAKEGRVVHFADRSTDPENDIVSRTWDFGDGDGGDGLGRTPTHMFDDDGEYTVTLTVTDAEGNEDTTEKQVKVFNEPPEASLDDVTAQQGELSVKFRMLDPGHVDKGELRWKLSSTNPAFPTHQGTDEAGVWTIGPFASLPAGTYPIRLDVEDKDGATASDGAVVVVTESQPPPPPPPPPVSFPTCDPNVTLSAEEREFLELVNEYRERNGVGPVRVSATLTKAADRHALDMKTHSFMRHEGSDGSLWAQRAYESGYPATAGVGENIATTDTAEDSLWAWRGSLTGHNENMLNPAWKAIGISREQGDKPYWATSYGTVQDCPADVDAGLAAASAPFEPTATKGGVEAEAAESETTTRATRAARTAAAAAFEEPARAGDFAASAPAASDYGPSPAVSVSLNRPRAGRPVEVVNRSRDSRGTLVGASVTFGDTAENPAAALAAGASRTHTYPATDGWEMYELRMTARDEQERDTLLRRWVSVDPVLPANLSLLSTEQIAVAGGEYDVSVRVRDPNTWHVVEGLELAFTAGGETVQASTNAEGVATATVTLADTEVEQAIEVAFAGTDDFKAAAVTKRVTAKRNTAPTAHAGGPYVTGEGGSLALDGGKSTDPDPSWFDRIAAYEWDLDGDGQYDDALGRLPRLIEGDELDQTVCGGPCDAGASYTVGLRVTDSHGASATATAPLRLVADFDLTLGGEAKTIGPNQSNNFAVTVLGSRSYDKPVTLSVQDLPAGVTATFSKNPVTPTDVSVLNLTGAAALQNGTFPLKVSATDGELTRTVTDQLTVAFGLIPVCKGTISGIVKDKTTGAPLGGAQVSVSGAWAETDASGRYVLEQVGLGTYNAPKSHTVSAALEGYWAQTGTGVATCGAVARVDIQLLDQRKGEVGGTVVDKATKQPLEDANIREQVCWLGCEFHKVAETGTGGKWSYRPLLANQNAERWWTARADAPGYWHQDKSVAVKEGVPVTSHYELVKRCNGTLAGGEVRYLGSDQIAPNAAVTVYGVPGTSRIELETDEHGKFVVDREVPLDYNNAPAFYRVDADPPATAPAGTTGDSKQFAVPTCGAESSVVLYLKTPVPNYGSLEGRVTDQETGAPVKKQYVQICGISCTLAQTDDNGDYHADDIHVGDDGFTSRTVTVSSEPTGYWKREASILVKKDLTSTLDLTLLKRRTGALKVSARDAVTGAPIPYAQVFEGASCTSFCLQTGREGDVTKTGIGLGGNNAPVSKSLTANAFGYWPQAKSVTITADNTTEVTYQLQPECEPAKVVGTVVNAETQAPIHKASVAGGLDHAVQTDEQGRFEIEGIKPSLGNNPRDVTLTASAAGFYSESKTIKIFCGAQITVDFGSRTSQTGTIVGTVIDDDTDQPIEDAFIGTTFGATAKTGVDGSFTITNVPLGDLDAPREWTVIAHPAGRKASTKTVVAEAGKQVRADFLYSSENERPVAEAKSIALDEDGEQTLKVAGTDADGDALTHHVMRFPEHGDLVGKAPNLTYRPDDDYHGPDSFEFLVNDGEASSERATVDITVRPVNDAPDARDDQLDALPDATTRFPAAALLANDTDPDGEPLQIVSASARNGEATVALDGDEIVFTPPAGWDKDVAYAFIDYAVEDGAGVRDQAIGFVKVKHGPAAPRCVDASFTTAPGTALADALDCTDVNGDELTYALVAGPAQGTLELAEDGSFEYTPADGFTGEASFTFKASDGTLESEVATATIEVAEPNAAPVCADVAATTDEDTSVVVELDCADADGDALQHELTGDPEHGTLERLSEGRYRYTPEPGRSGADSFGYRATDGAATAAGATANITVRPVDDAPNAGDTEIALQEDAAGVPVDLAALVTDEDTPAGDLSFAIAEAPAKGAVTGAGATRTYTPEPDAHGADALTYRVTDKGGNTAEGEVSITIAPVNDAPVAHDDAVAAQQDVPLSIPVATLLANDADQDGDELTVSSVGGAEHGSVAPDGAAVRFNPAAGFHGAARFSYEVTDGNGGTHAAKVTVQVAKADDPDPEPEQPEDPVKPEPTATPEPPEQEVKGEQQSGGELLLGCTDRSVVLEDVVPDGKRVRLLGVAERRHAGERAEIRFLGTGKVVARPVIGADGRFAATAPLPKGKLRHSNRARYDAAVAGQRSPALKLERRMQVTKVQAAAGKVTITGRVLGPRATRAADRAIEVQRRRSCSSNEVVARVKPGKDGRFRVTLAAPDGQRAAVYRLRARVRRTAASPRLFDTFTLPRAVDF